MASIFVTKFIGATVAQFTWASAIIQHFHSPNWMNEGLGSSRTFRANIWDQKGNPCTSNLIINNSSNAKAHTHPEWWRIHSFLCPHSISRTILLSPTIYKRNVSGTLCKLIAVAGVGINQSYLFDVRLGERAGPGLLSNRLHKLGRQKVHDDMVGMLLLLVQLVSA